MHILVIPSWYPESPEDVAGSFFREQAIALYRSGCKVGVIHPNICSLKRWRKIITSKVGFSQEVDSGIPTFRHQGVNWFPKVTSLSYSYYNKAGYSLYDQYTDKYGKPDVIHVQSMLNAGILAQYINAKHNIPYIISEHSSLFGRKLLSRGQLQACHTIAKGAVRRFAVSLSFCELLNGLLGNNGLDWEEMPNSVQEEFLSTPLYSNKKDAQGFRFVTVCLLTHKKGTHNLLQAFADAFRNQPSVTLDVGGDGPDRSRLEALAHSLGIKDQVRFLGMLSRGQVVETIAGADAFVLASQYETFGVVFVEALALGKPVIATRCGGPEGIIRSEDGVLVPLNDIDSLGQALKEVRTNSDRFQAQIIRAGCAERYGQAAVTKRLIKVYQDVFSNHNERPIA